MISARSCLVLVCVSWFTSACGLFSADTGKQRSDPQVSKQTLGEVFFSPLPLNHDPLEQPETQAMRDAYQILLDLVADPKTKQLVQYRLADLENALAEQKQESGLTEDLAAQPLFNKAIAQYQQLLIEHPQNPNNVDVLYQLAKAYEQQGQTQQSFDALGQLLRQYPNNDYLAEIHFRLGELEFNRGNYSLAIAAYKNVLEQAQPNPYFATGAYMLGWSYFKNQQHAEALKAFTRLLDHKLPNQVVAQSMLYQLDSQKQIAGLAVGEKRLVTDTIRIMSMLFSYQDAQYASPAQSITVHFSQLKNRHYEYVLYDALAQHYLNQDRYRDSALAYQAFTKSHPEHVQAPIFAVKQIDAYILGKFPTLVLPAKQAFVTRYGIEGDYWQNWPIVLQEQVAPYLNDYLQQLALFEHSRAQILVKSSQKLPVKPNQKNSLKAQQLKQQSTQAFMLAIQWYQQFILTFPEDKQTPESTYRLAEAFLAVKQYADAITTFENYAYQHLQPASQMSIANPKAAEAAYAAILAYSNIQQPADMTKSEWTTKSAIYWIDKQLNAQQRFVEVFASDPRSHDILYNSMQQLFNLNRYQLAMQAAQKLLTRKDKIQADKALASYLVLGHSQFALQLFSEAEMTYDQVLALLPESDTRRVDMRDRLAASIYKQAEQKVKNQDLPLAINDFLRVIAKTPESTIRITAQYDAASYLLQLQKWQQAIAILEDFKHRFANHKLSKNIQQGLILAYQQNENWLQAANELMLLHQNNPQSEEARQALYIAAQYFQKTGNRDQALAAYRTYAHSYAKPFAEANEARFIMSEFYLTSNEPNKRRFWLKKLIHADNQAQTSADIERDARSRFLAAMASTVFADDKLVAFKKIKLSQPLKASLASKKTALNNALDAYNKVLSYKIEEFTTSANFNIADIYHQLAKDLLASSKPKDLSALELEQYNLLLEEQAYPFEEKAIGLHQTNTQRSWNGSYDVWVQKSFAALAKLLPGRFNKQEKSAEVIDDIY